MTEADRRAAEAGESLAASIAEQVRNPRPPEESPVSEARPIGEFRRNFERICEMMDAAVDDARRKAAENAHLTATVSAKNGEINTQASTIETLRLEIKTLTERLQEEREAKIRLQAHIEATGRGMINFLNSGNQP